MKNMRQIMSRERYFYFLALELVKILEDENYTETAREYRKFIRARREPKQ